MTKKCDACQWNEVDRKERDVCQECMDRCLKESLISNGNNL